jgi:hypothetical protein
MYISISEKCNATARHYSLATAEKLTKSSVGAGAVLRARQWQVTIIATFKCFIYCLLTMDEQVA